MRKGDFPQQRWKSKRMRQFACRFIVAAIASFIGTIAAVSAQSPEPVATGFDRSIHVTIDGVQIVQKDFGILLRGIYSATITQIGVIRKKPSQMPVQSPYVYFAGRNATT